MSPLTSFAIIALAGLIHASFQLSISMLTLISSHATGKQLKHRRIVRLTGGFLFGAILATFLLISAFSFSVHALFGQLVPPLVWSIACGLMIGVGLAVWLFYYRHATGTSLWIPRPLAHFLTARSTDVVHTAEAFSLGLTSVIAEIVFIIAPLAVSALAIVQLPAPWQFVGALTYTLLASSSLLFVYVLVGSGRSISRIQKWRETNKQFLRFIAGTALVVLSGFIYAYEVIGNML